MKSAKLLLIAVVLSSLAASSAMARPSGARTNSTGRNIHSAVRTSANHSGHNNGNWHRHHRHHSRVYFSLGYPFGYGYGYPYYSSYPYRYGYYARPREVVYDATTADGSIVAAVQRRLTQAGYYRGMIDGVIGPKTRSAIRLYERAHGLGIDGQIDRRLLATMGLA
jgi:hypothetical protein